MNRRTLIPVLLILAVLALGYAIYRSTAVRTIVMENGQQQIYNEPQHGLTLGLCIFSGMCLLGIVGLMGQRDEVRNEPPVTVTKRNTSTTSTNYPQ
ncbi:MAG TPA: hypothetical protein VNR87_17450 [Flavisolibacter sp.]|nr:hypothetical protein [Flavisolibacter sp.]